MRNIFLIAIGFVFLIFCLIVGYPFEIRNLTIDRYLMVLLSGLLVGLAYLIYRLIKRLKNKTIKNIYLTLLICISLIYSWIGIWTIMISSKNGPFWEDVTIYGNKNKCKVISQFRETSGSIYDYRERLVLHEFSNNNRISIEWTKKRMHGIWNAKDLKNDSVYIENFDRINKNAP